MPIKMVYSKGSVNVGNLSSSLPRLILKAVFSNSQLRMPNLPQILYGSV